MIALEAVGGLQARVESLNRWAARSLAFVLGFISVLAMAPLYQFYLLIPAFSGLLWLSAAAPTRWQAFCVGWGFGAGFFGASLYWVSFALLVDAEKFAWLVPFAILGFAFGLGLFGAVLTLVVHALPGRNLVAKALVLAGMWTVLEWLRTWLFTGLPWNPLGSAWLFSETLSQGVAVVGTLGLSLLAALVAVAPATLGYWGEGSSRRARVGLFGGVGLAVVALFVGGQHRLANAPDAVVPDVRLRLIQPNILQSQKWQADLRTDHMANQLELSARSPLPGEVPPTHIIWAETMAPFFIANHPGWLRAVGASVPQDGLVILGAPRVVSNDAAKGLQVANSLLAIDRSGTVRGTYDKFHLVPFGEYVPLRDWLPLDRITQGLGAFTPGPGPQTLDLPGLPPVSPLICYEIIFPATATDGTGRARWLLNITNDAWYGKTAGPHQHFVNARLRALEQGLPVVRVAGTGISGIIDSYGRVRASLAIGEKGFIDGDLPVPASRATVYAGYGDGPALVLALLALVGGWLCVWRPRNRTGGDSMA